jgi:uncharacterized protein
MKMDIYDFNGKKIAEIEQEKDIKGELEKAHHIFPAGEKSGKKICFANYLKRFYLVDDEAYEKILKQYNMAVRNPPKIKRDEKGFTTLSIALTNECPLKCVYCFGAGGERKKRIADWETIKASIDYLSQFDEYIKIVFLSTGEQTIPFKLLKKTVHYAKEKLNIVGTGVSTSGIINKEVCEWLAKNIDSVQVSFDGAPEIHDRQRPLKDGSPSSPYVIKTIKRLQELGVDYLVRGSITHLFLKKIEYAIRYLKKLGVKRATFMPLKPIGRARYLKLPSVEEVTEGMMKIIELKDHYEINIEFGMERIFGLLTPRACNIGYNFCLALDGKVSACPMYVDGDDLKILPGIQEFIFGYYDKKRKAIVIDEEKLARHRKFSKEVRCDLCKFKLCRGACPYVNIQETGDILTPAIYLCQGATESYKKILRYRTQKLFFRKRPYFIQKKARLAFLMYHNTFEVQKTDVYGSLEKNPFIKIPFPCDEETITKLKDKIIKYHNKECKRIVLFFLSFEFKKKGSEDDLHILEKFLADLTNHNIFFKITKPLRPFFNEGLLKRIKEMEAKYKIPKNCKECLELFTVIENNQVQYCNGLKASTIEYFEDRDGLFDYFKKNSEERCYVKILKRSCK